ncbi:EPIDERMAL PATTERNING FACTOR 1-like protein [Drosera capensis]
MRSSGCVVVVILIIITLSSRTSSRHISKPRLDKIEPATASRRVEIVAAADNGKQNSDLNVEKRGVVRQRKGPDTLQVAGSSLPDCSHACGSCRPCRLVMVSFVCASLAEAETCPMAYKLFQKSVTRMVRRLVMYFRNPLPEWFGSITAMKLIQINLWNTIS